MDPSLPTFDAGSVVEPLDYTFEPEVPGCKGRIPEPSTAQVQAFQVSWREELLRFKDEMELSEEVTREQFMDALEKSDPTKLGPTMKTQAKMHSALAGGVMTADQIQQLGHRKQIAFQRWLQGQVLNPEVKNGDGQNPGS